FFVEGWGFYKRANLRENGSIFNAIKWGRRTEAGDFGLVTTGVFSHADLVANFNGMRFWNQLLMFNPDPIDQTITPILNCENGNWSIERTFDFSDFVDPAMDEGINCNFYRSKKIQQHVSDKIIDNYRLLSLFSRSFSFCPIYRKRCLGLSEKYGDYANLLLHPTCLEK
ncbi:MAG: hypothetical protein HN730_06260, partial [Bdellovibrionales bacterium]|nr:hypothetical protein [Bdellovibrionales bacterium]